VTNWPACMVNVDAIAAARKQGTPPGAGFLRRRSINRSPMPGGRRQCRYRIAGCGAELWSAGAAGRAGSRGDRCAAPHEAFVAITLSEHGGWVFCCGPATRPSDYCVGGSGRHGEHGETGPPGSSGIELTATGLPHFDIAGAQRLYTDTLGGVAQSLDGVTALVIAPDGPLLSVPFGVLLTGPAEPDALASAPWLVRKFAVADVPAAANFVSLRKIAGTSRASRPWFGFGNFRPITLAQAQRSFPGATCADSARLLAGLPALPYTLKELDAARQIMGAGTSDELLGPAFTVDAVTRMPLKDYRTLQFSTHALLPAELHCQINRRSSPPRRQSSRCVRRDADGRSYSRPEFGR